MLFPLQPEPLNQIHGPEEVSLPEELRLRHVEPVTAVRSARGIASSRRRQRTGREAATWEGSSFEEHLEKREGGASKTGDKGAGGTPTRKDQHASSDLLPTLGRLLDTRA